MAKPEQIQNDELRPILQDAHRALRERDPTTAVRRCADAFLKLAALYPRVTQLPPSMRVHPWPRLGANLVLEEGQPPRIEFHRDEFSFAEAVTYYEYTLTTTIAAERRAAEAAAEPSPAP
jgi:hypothetical protein